MNGIIKKLGELIKCSVYLVQSMCNFKKGSEHPTLGKVTVAGRAY
jgi:hypothetical protein